MKYQVFLKVKDKNQMCSRTVEAKDENEAKIKALNEAKNIYGLDFVVFKILKSWKVCYETSKK